MGGISIPIKQEHWHCPIFLTGKKRLKGEKSMFRSGKLIIRSRAMLPKGALRVCEIRQTREVSLFRGAVAIKPVCHTGGSNVTTPYC